MSCQRPDLTTGGGSEVQQQWRRGSAAATLRLGRPEVEKKSEECGEGADTMLLGRGHHMRESCFSRTSMASVVLLSSRWGESSRFRISELSISRSIPVILAACLGKRLTM